MARLSPAKKTRSLIAGFDPAGRKFWKSRYAQIFPDKPFDVPDFPLLFGQDE